MLALRVDIKAHAHGDEFDAVCWPKMNTIIGSRYVKKQPFLAAALNHGRSDVNAARSPSTCTPHTAIFCGLIRPGPPSLPTIY